MNIQTQYTFGLTYFLVYVKPKIYFTLKNKDYMDLLTHDILV